MIESGISLYDWQLKAVKQMKNGCILCGDVGSGKSRTALAYYYLLNGGKIDPNSYYPMEADPLDLYIITTARKRDTFEWDEEMVPFVLSTHDEIDIYNHKVVVDSWNNIHKYIDVENAFFIFDEQRVVGYGKWTKSFLKITKQNQWILLSATPGDTWLDYMPVFIANGFYKNKTDFVRQHVVYTSFSNFPKVDRYVGTGRLIRLRNNILVNMDYNHKIEKLDKVLSVEYDRDLYKQIVKERWNVWNDEPIENASEYCYCLRRAVNSSESRLEAVGEVLKEHPKCIIFYNYDYELELLQGFLEALKWPYSEWNGHKHQDILVDSEKWVYLVQYNAGNDGWNCTRTNTILFYSQNYSYKIMKQAAGRIDRMNTPYFELYYYYLKSSAGIDRAINRAIERKKKFNESRFYERG